MKKIVVVLAVFATVPAAAADLSMGLVQCGGIAEPKLRLACYDGLAEDTLLALQRAESAANNSYREMSLTDFKLDKAQLIGKQITTTGRFGMFADEGMLHEGDIDTS